MGPEVDIAITHGPTKGVLDRKSSRERAGSAGLFAAIARSRPQLHCFGHIHEAHGVSIDEEHQRVNVNAALHHHSQPIIVDLLNHLDNSV